MDDGGKVLPGRWNPPPTPQPKEERGVEKWQPPEPPALTPAQVAREAERREVLEALTETAARFGVKNEQYTGERSVFDNFVSGAALTRWKLNPAQVLLLYMAKHVNRLYDGFLVCDQPMGQAELDEAAGDVMLYLAILRAMGRRGLL
jgi:hypothetical protein